MKNLILYLNILCASLIMNAQITITNVNMPVIGDTVRYSIAALNSVGDYTSTGANYVWHFDTLRIIGQGRRDFTNNTPYLMFFGPSKYGEKIRDTIISQNIPGYGQVTITDFYQFYKNTPSVFEVEGAGVKINNIPVPSFYSDKDELYFLPLSYGQRDSSTFKFSTPTTTAVPFVYKKNGYRITEADGWGTITTPYGTFNCLRVITTQYSKDTIIFNSTFGSIPYGFNNYQRSYQWLSNTEKIPILEVSGNIGPTGNFVPSFVRFRDNYRVVSVEEYQQKNKYINVFPNPSDGNIKVENIFNSNIQISVYSINGQNVFNTTEYAGFGDYVDVDLSHLPNGHYYGMIKSENNIYLFKLEIVK